MPMKNIKGLLSTLSLGFFIVVSLAIPPKRAEAIEVIMILQTGLAVYSATSAGLTPIMATVKMITSKRTEGVSSSS